MHISNEVTIFMELDHHWQGGVFANIQYHSCVLQSLLYKYRIKAGLIVWEQRLPVLLVVSIFN